MTTADTFQPELTTALESGFISPNNHAHSMPLLTRIMSMQLYPGIELKPCYTCPGPKSEAVATLTSTY